MIRNIIKTEKRLLHFTKGAQLYLFSGVFCIAITRLLSTWLMAKLLGDTVGALQQDNFYAIGDIIYSVVPLLLLIIFVQASSLWLTDYAKAQTTVAMRNSLFDIALNSTLSASQNIQSGEKLSLYSNDVPAATSAMVDVLAQPVSLLITGLISFIYVYSIHPYMAFLGAAAGLISYGYSIFFAKHLHQLSVKMQQLLAILESRLKNLLDGMITARMYGFHKQVQEQMEDVSNNLQETGIRWGWSSGWLGGINNGLGELLEAFFLFFAGYLLFTGEITTPTLLKVSYMTGGIIRLFRISRLLVSAQKALAGAERVFRYIDTTLMEKSGSITETSNTLKTVEFSSVGFGYSSKKNIFSELSFCIRKGELAVIVGSSGKGKSTILRLIEALYFPTVGDVYVYGINTKNWNLTTLRNHIVLVSQESILFSGTVAENIALGRNDVCERDIINAAKQAGADEFICRMEDGYNTFISEKGGSLSGGQRQRIALARALLTNAEILLLDEVTSAMDTSSENYVIHSIEKLKGNKTIIAVTHRNAILSIADKVITIESQSCKTTPINEA